MLVLDTSVTVAWCFPDETSAYADAVLDHLRCSRAFVPSVWPLEVANILVVGERRRRLLPTQSDQFISLLGRLPIEIEHRPHANLLADLVELARVHALSSCDAAYLDIATRLALPIATLDTRLAAAAQAAGVPVFAP